MQSRPQTAVFWVAIVLMAALVPFVPAAIFAVVLTLAVFTADLPVQPLQRAVVVRDAQPLSLLAVTRFRGPPSLGSLV
jgi:hypothetical protein